MFKFLLPTLGPGRDSDEAIKCSDVENVNEFKPKSA